MLGFGSCWAASVEIYIAPGMVTHTSYQYVGRITRYTLRTNAYGSEMATENGFPEGLRRVLYRSQSSTARPVVESNEIQYDVQEGIRCSIVATAFH